jgi:hypothetical protein
MDKGMLWLSFSLPALTFVATHIILPGQLNEIAVDSRPLGPVPPGEMHVIMAKLKGHKHLFQANVPQDGTFSDGVGPGFKDFCILFRVKVPVNPSLLIHQLIYS